MHIEYTAGLFLQTVQNNLPILPLDEALVSPYAMYGRSQIIGLQDSSSNRSTRNAHQRLQTTFRNIPGVSVRKKGILHEKTGTAFIELTIEQAHYLVGCISAKEISLMPERPVEIVTGSCMFGIGSITGYSAGHTYNLRC
jgi:hypothetical protein